MSEDHNKESSKKQKMFTTQKRRRARIKKKILSADKKLNTTESRDLTIFEEESTISQHHEHEKTNLRNGSLDSSIVISANNIRSDTTLTKIQNRKESLDLNRNDDIIRMAIEIIQGEDTNEISEVLGELSEKLSISHESIAENTNCTHLIKELLKLLDKLRIPEIQSKYFFYST